MNRTIPGKDNDEELIQFRIEKTDHLSQGPQFNKAIQGRWAGSAPQSHPETKASGCSVIVLDVVVLV